MKTKNHASAEIVPLTYTYHARIRASERALPIFRSLPATATLWDIDYDREASRFLLNSNRGPVCLVLSDREGEEDVVITTYDPRRRDHWW